MEVELVILTLEKLTPISREKENSQNAVLKNMEQTLYM